MLLILLLITLFQPSFNTLLTQKAYLYPNQTHNYVPIYHNNLLFSNTSLITSSNLTLSLRISLKLKHQNRTFITSNLKTSNIIIKYWKNEEYKQNTLLSERLIQIMNQPYNSLAKTKYFQTNKDKHDNGQIDIQSIYEYKSEHNFIFKYNYTQFTYAQKFSIEPLFVIAVYRANNSQLTQMLQMSNKQDQIEATIVVQENNNIICTQCQTNSLCTVRNCQCYQEKFTDCNLKRQSVYCNTMNNVMEKNGTIVKGNIKYFSTDLSMMNNVQGDIFNLQMQFEFNDIDLVRNKQIESNSIYIFMKAVQKQNKLNQIANIYNYDKIISPSFTSPIFRNLQQSQPSSFTNISSRYRLSTSQQLLFSIHYIPRLQQQQLPQISYLLTFQPTSLPLSPQINSQLSMGLIIGCVIIGIFSTLLLICLINSICSIRRCSFNFIINIFNNNRDDNNRFNLKNKSFLMKFCMNYKKFVLPIVKYGLVKQSNVKRILFNDDDNKKSKKKFNVNRLITKKTIQSTQLCDKQHFHQQQQQMCIICLEQFNMQTNVKYTLCGHIICAPCLDQWFYKQLTCPLCRQGFDMNNILSIDMKINQQIENDDKYKKLLEKQCEQLESYIKSKLKIIDGKINQSEQKIKLNQQINQNIEHFVPTLQSMINVQRQINNSQFIQQNNLITLHTLKSQKSLQLTKQINHQWAQNILNVFKITQTSIDLKKVIQIVNLYRFCRLIYLYHEKNKKYTKMQSQYQDLLQQDNNNNVGNIQFNNIYCQSEFIPKTPLKYHQNEQNQENSYQQFDLTKKKLIKSQRMNQYDFDYSLKMNTISHKLNFQNGRFFSSHRKRSQKQQKNQINIQKSIQRQQESTIQIKITPNNNNNINFQTIQHYAQQQQICKISKSQQKSQLIKTGRIKSITDQMQQIQRTIKFQYPHINNNNMFLYDDNQDEDKQKYKPIVQFQSETQLKSPKKQRHSKTISELTRLKKQFHIEQYGFMQNQYQQKRKNTRKKTEKARNNNKKHKK